MPNKPVAFITGEDQAKDVIFSIVRDIAGATWNNLDGTPATNPWSKVYEISSDYWVTYQEKTRTGVQGVYKHTDGRTFNVYQLKDVSGVHTPDDRGHTPKYAQQSDGYVYEISGTSNTRTGKKVNVSSFTYTDSDGVTQTVTIPGSLAVLIDGVAYLVSQTRVNLDGTESIDPQWNEFKIVTELPDDWAYVLSLPNQAMTYAYAYSYYDYWTGETYAYFTVNLADPYTFTERYYQPDPVHTTDAISVLKYTPPVSNSVEKFVMLRHPYGQYNYFDVYYGLGFTGVSPSGDSKTTWERACDPATVNIGMIPTVINQKEAEAAYLRQTNGGAGSYTSPSHSWGIDPEDGVTVQVSPPSHFFFGADSVVSWVPNKKRRSDYLVSYAISVNEDRVCLIIEGDPSPDIEGYYRSFGYFGTIVPFNESDVAGNFAVTVGMGDAKVEKTGMVYNDISPENNPSVYGKFGRYTSNGMYSVSMLATRSNVLFQAYYPAFVTQLPNYSDVGTIPPELSKLELEKNGFQASDWTKKYHASPIYLAHLFEGYRGFMSGVVAITDHNIVNEDELVVDTEEWKDPNDHSKGTWTEVYKFYSLNKSPINFFKKSANPSNAAIAILKEVK